MGWIRLGCGSDLPAHGVELPHQPGISLPGVGRGYPFNAVVAPEAAHAAESRDAAFRAHSRPAEDEDAVGRGNGEHGRVHGRGILSALGSSRLYRLARPVGTGR